MRIGYLTGEYPRATDTFIQREVSTLRSLGIEIQTFSIRRPSIKQLVGEEQKTEFKQTVYLLPPRIFRLFSAHLALFFTAFPQYLKALSLAWKTCQPGLKGFIYQVFYFAEAGILAREIQSQNLEHLHNHLADSSCTVAMLAAEMVEISFSFTVHGPYIFFEPYRWFLGEKIKRALFVACISHFCRSQCMLFVPMECWSKLHIVHCGVDPKLFLPIKHTGSGSQLLYVGRLSAAKGVPILLESLAKLKDAHPDILLTVIGDGGEREHLEKLVFDLGLSGNVKLVGYKSQTEVRQYLRETDIFILPSFAEGVPVSLMEAMASGVPVISTRIAGISELVQDEVSGYLVSPGNIEQLSEKILHLYANPECRQSFGEAGRNYVIQEFNLEKEPFWLSEIMRAALQGSGSPIRKNYKN
jgi:colanic acid/amylovoran biosynthesis glycosyltransferase